MQRERLIKTFNVRHRPLTDGSDRSDFARDFFPAEPGWDMADENTGEDFIDVFVTPALGPTAATGPALEWDSDNETWVHATTGTHRAPHATHHTPHAAHHRHDTAISGAKETEA